MTAAAEFSVGLDWAESMALAEVTGANIGPSTLAAIGRGLALRGNYVAEIQADPIGGLTFLQAASWDIAGSADPATWTYHLDLPGPSQHSDVIRGGPDTIHCRINQLPESSWSGRSPLVAAGFSATLLANLELRSSQEAKSFTGHLAGDAPTVCRK